MKFWELKYTYLFNYDAQYFWRNKARRKNNKNLHKKNMLRTADINLKTCVLTPTNDNIIISSTIYFQEQKHIRTSLLLLSLAYLIRPLAIPIAWRIIIARHKPPAIVALNSRTPNTIRALPNNLRVMKTLTSSTCISVVTIVRLFINP